MLNLGKVKPGSIIRIPFGTYDGGTGASLVMTDYAAADIEVYKDGSATQRASDAGYTATTTFDSITGIHLCIVDLADNTTGNFFEAGSEYFVIIGPVTIDGQTVNFPIARFVIGYEGAVLDTTIATLAGQTSFTLEDGSADDNAYNGCTIYVHDLASAIQVAIGYVLDYTGASKTVTLAADPSIFTMAAGDNISFFPPVNVMAVSADPTAADNLELQYDGTGLTGGTFPATQDGVGAIGTVGGAALNFAAADDNVDGALNGVTFVGVQTSGTFVSTEAEDGTNHVIDDDTDNIDILYQFNIGGGRTGTEVIWKGFLAGSGDSVNIQVYDFVGSDWETRAVITGKNQSVNETIDFPILSKHTGTGANIGIVYVRFVVASATDPTLETDELIVEAVSIGQSVGYQNGAVWIDTNDGVAGTESFVNGVADNPVSNIADALTIAAANNLKKFTVSPGSTITLGATFINKEMEGHEWTLDLNGQDIGGSEFIGAAVSGIGTNTTGIARFIDCQINATTIPTNTHLLECSLASTITLQEAGDYFLDQCWSTVAGTSTPVLDFGAGLNASNVSVRHYSGGLEIQNMGAGTGSYDMSLEGHGQLVINANCSATSAVAIRGNFTVTDNAGGVVTLSDDARIDVAQIGDATWDEALSGHQTQGTAGAAITMAAYSGSRGPGVYIDDAAANTGTTLGDDGTLENPVSTIAAATTIAVALGITRFYLTNNTAITLAQTYEDHEFIGIGVMNQVNLGSQDVDNTIFHNVLLTGTQGGTQFMRAIDCQLQAILSAEILADDCWITGDITLRAATNHSFGHCKSGTPGNATPELTFPGSGTTSVNWRHYSGGLQVNSATVNDTMSYETDGQLIIDATCTSLAITVRGNCTITDNGTTTVLTQDAAVTRTSINEEADMALSDYDGPTEAEMNTAHALLATPAQVNAQVISALRAVGMVLTTSTIETVTSQTQLVIPATDDAPDDDAYNDALAVVIDGTDPNQVSFRPVDDYDAGTRTVTLTSAPDFTVTTSDTLVILSTAIVGVAAPSAGTVAAAVWAEAFAELAAIPGATPTTAQMLQFVFQYFKFMRTGSGSTAQELMYQRDGTTELGTAVLRSDGTDFTKEEFQ